MSDDFENITSAIPLDVLSPAEVDATFRCILSTATIQPDAPNAAVYGNAVSVTHKVNGERILEIRADRQYWKKEKRHFLELVNRAANPSEIKIQSRIVFSRGGDFSTYPFRWKDDFQLGRVPDGSSKPSELWALYPCLFQFAVQHTGLPWLDAHRIESAFKKRFLPLLPLMRQYCTTELEYDPSPSARKLWVIERYENEIHSCWRQAGYHLPTSLNDSSFFTYEQPTAKILPIDRIDPYWLTSINLSQGYSLYESLDLEDQSKFLLGCEWFNKALVAEDSTDQVLFLMIMLEIFLPSDSATCEKCGQPEYKISEKFRTFIPEVIGLNWTQDFTGVLNKLYTLRSRIAHTGIAVAQYSGGMLPIEWREQNQKRYLFQLARQFLVSWLFYRSLNGVNDRNA